MMAKISSNDFRFKLICMSVVILLILKLVKSTAFLSIIINSMIEFSVFFIIYYLFKTVRIPKLGFMKYPKIVIYYLLFICNFFIFSVTDFYFNDALVMKYSIYDLSWGSSGFFVQSLLGWRFILLFLVMFLAAVILARIKFKEVNVKSKPMLLICILIFFLPFSVYPLVTNTYATSFYDMSSLLFGYNLELEKQPINIEMTRPYLAYDKYNLSDKRILLFIMEQTDYEAFEKGLSKIPDEDNFFMRIYNNSQWYRNYYSINQDSRTGIWIMLTSQFIPFESYSLDWNENYGYILEEPNLVDLLRYHGYKTKVAAAMYEPSLLLGAYKWDKNIFLKEYPVEDALCMHEFEYQKGCEDNVMLDDVKAELHDRKQFLMQEMIFGHGEGYMRKSKKTRVEYYNDYFNEIYNYLEDNNLLNDTLMVIVSDHGDKGYLNKKIDDYNIPLIVFDKSLEHKDIDVLYSQLAFRDILLSYLGGDTAVRINDSLIIGQTSSRAVGYIDSNGGYFTGTMTSQKGLHVSKANIGKRKVSEKAGQLLTYRGIVQNMSSQSNYWCEQCVENRKQIIAARVG